MALPSLCHCFGLPELTFWQVLSAILAEAHTKRHDIVFSCAAEIFRQKKFYPVFGTQVARAVPGKVVILSSVRLVPPNLVEPNSAVPGNSSFYQGFD